MSSFVARLRHDLLKPATWRARDLTGSDEAPTADDLRAIARALDDLRDEEGRAVSAPTLWRLLRAELDGASSTVIAAADAFGRALEAALAEVREANRGPFDPARARSAIERLLALEPAAAAIDRALARAKLDGE